MSTRRASLGIETVRLTASKVITLCISMATTMLLARFRSFEEYGTYSQLLMVISLSTSLLMLGLPNSINYFLARADSGAEQRRFLSVYYTISTMLSFAIGVTLVLAIPIIERYFHNPRIRNYFYFLALYPWASIISASVENILVVYKQTGFLMGYRVVYSMAMLGLVVIIQKLGYGFDSYMMAFVVVNAFFSLVVYAISFFMSGGIYPLIDPKLIGTIFAFSIPIGLASVVGTLSVEIDKLLIGYLMNTEQLAVYTNAARELPVTVVAASITAVLLPQLTRMVKENKGVDAVRLWGHATELSFAIIALIVAGVFTFAKEAMTILYSAKYLGGLNVFRIYTLNLLLRCTYFGMVLNACGQTKKIFICSLLSLIFNAVLNPLFYFIFGMIGPAIATFLAILLIQLLQLYMTAKMTGLSFGQVFPWVRLSRILCVNVLFSLIFSLVKHFIPIEASIGEIGESVALGIVWTILYLIVIRNRLQVLWRSLNQGGTT